MRVICITAVIFMGLTGAAIFGTCVSGQGVSAQQAGERVEAEGELEVYYEDYEYDSRLFFFLKTARERLELRFAGRAPDHFQTGDSVRVRGRRSGQTITPDAGDGVTSATATTTSTTTSTAILPRTFGEQKVLAMLVNFQDNPNARPWTPESARNLVFGTVNNYFRESSYQQTWLTGEVAGWFTLPMNSTCDTTMIASLANQAAAGAGYTPSNYGRLVYTFPSLSCGFSGQGTIGGIPSKSWINGSMTLRTVAHELEHNLGLYHAQALSCGGSVLGDNCTWIEYGDALDILGKSGVTGHSHAFQKERLGWLNYGSSPGITLVDADGTYWIEPYETTGQNPKALKIFKSTDASSGRRIYYYVEFRRPVGFDSFISNNGNIMNGVMVHTGMESAGSSNYMLDMTPETSSMNDPALPVNRSYNDAVAGVTMTVLSVSDWGANVSVAFGPQSCTQASPTVSVSPSQGQWVSAGTAVNYTVSVTNNNSGSCAASGFNLQAGVPGGWSAVFNSPILSLNTGESGGTTLRVTSPADAAEGFYNFGVTATNGSVPSYSASASATYALISALSASVSTDRASYTMKDAVKITARVSAAGSPAAGASLSFQITKPNGAVATGSAKTGADGTAVYTYRFNKRQDPSGSYQVSASASVNGASGNSSTSFLLR